MRKGYWKLKQFLQLCYQFVDVRFASKITITNCEMIVQDNSNTQLRLRLSGETWPPYIVYKFVSVSQFNSILPYINSSQFSTMSHQSYIKPVNTSVKNMSINLGLNNCIKDYTYAGNSNKEDLIKIYNSKDNY